MTVLLILFGASAPAFSSDTFRFGVSPGFVRAEVNDPDGNSASKTSVEILNVVMTQAFGRDSRMLYQGYYHAFNLDAGTSDIGQHVNRNGFSFSFQSAFHVARGWAPWGGVGLGLTEEKYKNRHTVDSGGFLATEYPDRKTTNYGVLLNAGTQWNLTRNWDAGIHVQYEQALGDGISAAYLSFMLLY